MPRIELWSTCFIKGAEELRAISEKNEATPFQYKGSQKQDFFIKNLNSCCDLKDKCSYGSGRGF